MSNLNPRLRIIDLNELEERRSEHSKNNSTPWASLYTILIEGLEDPSKTKELLSEVYDKGFVQNVYLAEFQMEKNRDDLIKKIVG